MSFDEVGSIVRAVYEAIDVGDFTEAARHVAEDVQVTNVATGDVYDGRDGYLEFARGWMAAFPDLRLRSLSLAGNEERWVSEYEIDGTHTGPLIMPRGHIPPTGAAVQFRCCDVLDLRDGEIFAIRSYFDSISLLRQLGLIAGTPLHAPDRRASLDLYAQPVDGNAPQRHKAIVHRFFQEVFGRQNPGAAADTCGPDFVWHGGALGEVRGLQAYQQVLAGFFQALPDLELEILDTVAEGDRVVVRFSINGTHLGIFHGIAPTLKRIAGGGTSTFRIEESRLVEEWWQGDLLVQLQQMDAAPSAQRLSS